MIRRHAIALTGFALIASLLPSGCGVERVQPVQTRSLGPELEGENTSVEQEFLARRSWQGQPISPLAYDEATRQVRRLPRFSSAT